MDRSLVAEPCASFGFLIKNGNLYPYALCIVSLSPQLSIHAFVFTQKNQVLQNFNNSDAVFQDRTAVCLTAIQNNLY